jgi:prepilin-type N-terminal cleavage/methylation domain-containing protein
MIKKGEHLMKNSKGFTLIELLIVMAVISILIGIAIPSFRGMQNEARRTRAQGECRTIQTAIESYFMDHNIYPAETNYQSILIANVPRVMPNALYDPFGATSTTTYVYSLATHNPSTSSYYIIYSVGINRTGVASVSTAGVITASNDAIYSSNGH